MNVQATAILDLSKFKNFQSAGIGVENQSSWAEISDGTLKVCKVSHILGVGTLEKSTLIVSGHCAILSKEIKGLIDEISKHNFTNKFDFNELELIDDEMKQAGPDAIFKHLSSTI